MRWVAFGLCAATTLVLQSAIAPRLEILGVRPDWILVVVVFFGLYALPMDAVIGAWILGFFADLMTIERLGLMAVSYMMAALFVVSIRDYLFCHRPATQFVVTLLTCLGVQAAWLVYRRLLYDPAEFILWDVTKQVVLVSLYTAGWALVIHRSLYVLAGWLGIPRPRYTHAGLNRTVRISV